MLYTSYEAWRGLPKVRVTQRRAELLQSFGLLAVHVGGEAREEDDSRVFPLQLPVGEFGKAGSNGILDCTFTSDS